MNDEFLYKLRKSPRPRFAEALYTKILNQPRSQTMLLTSLKRIGWALAVLCLVLALTAAISPAARASMLEVVHNIGGMLFNETSQLELPPNYISSDQLPEQTLTWAEAQAALPFSLSLPTWLPEGFTFDNQHVTVFHSPEHSLGYAEMRWQSPATTDWKEYIYLRIEYQNGTSTSGEMQVGPESLEEVSVNDQPAALVRGAWYPETGDWGATDLMNLRWERPNGYTFHLVASENVISEGELIRIAESIP